MLASRTAVISILITRLLTNLTIIGIMSVLGLDFAGRFLVVLNYPRF